MAQRKSTFRMNSEAVQGEGSFVILRFMRVEEHIRYREDVKRPEHDAYLGSMEVLRDHVVEWNWVDEQGNPLPTPTQDPEVLRRLTDPEADFLTVSLLRGPRDG